MPGQVQLSNDEQMTLLSSRFPQRDEPNFAWGNVGSFYSILPALRAFWPCGPQYDTGQSVAIADTALNRHLTIANNPQFGYESLIQYVNFDGANQYAYYPDAPQFDILGDEAYNTYPGLTLGCWIYPDRAVGTLEYIMAKFNNGFPLTSAYRLHRSAAGILQFEMCDGVGLSGLQSTSLIRQSVWQFVAGRFVPGVSSDNYLSTAIGSLEKTSAVNARVAILNSAFNFTMATDATPTRYFDGKISLAWICASALSDTIINALYQLSRPLFGQ